MYGNSSDDNLITSRVFREKMWGRGEQCVCNKPPPHLTTKITFSCAENRGKIESGRGHSLWWAWS